MLYKVFNVDIFSLSRFFTDMVIIIERHIQNVKYVLK